jgi:hypothetical protein
MTPQRTNGERSFYRWLVGIVTTILVLWATWVSVSIVQAKVDSTRIDQISRDVQWIRDRLQGPAR